MLKLFMIGNQNQNQKNQTAPVVHKGRLMSRSAKPTPDGSSLTRKGARAEGGYLTGTTPGFKKSHQRRTAFFLFELIFDFDFLS